MKNKKINIHGKSSLARLMAIENLHVTHDPAAQTASFDLKNRVVTLPILKEMTGFIYDWFIAHEISHALYTPPKEYIALAKETHPALANICEDARIEKLIKRKYPGSVRDCYKFYKHFSDDKQDFFGLKDVPDLNTLTLADKLNLHFKIGSFKKVPFAPEEMYFVEALDKAETFPEIDKITRELFDWMKQNNQVQEIMAQAMYTLGEGEEGDGDGEGADGDMFMEADGDGDSSSSSNGKQSGSDQNDKQKGKTFKAVGKFKPLGHTQDSFDNNMRGMYETNSNIMFGDIHDGMQDVYEKFIILEDKTPTPATQDKTSEGEYNNFLRSITPTINMMISHFNMKKAAKDFQRKQLGKTGRLDMKKISLYEINSDIFRKNELLPEAQNHGIVMFIDWSSSMTSHMFSTMKQLMILMEFCRKTSIPFEVYGFTSPYYDYSGGAIKPIGGDIYGDGTQGRLFRLFTSTMRLDAFRKRSQWVFSCCSKRNASSIYPMYYTPLNLSAFLSEYVVRDFQKNYNCEKTVFVLLSDGEPTDSLINGVGTLNSNYKVVMRDKSSNRNYTVDNYSSAYHNILDYVKNKCNIWKTIGFYVTDKLSEADINLICPKFPKGQQKDAIKKFKESKSYIFPKYDAFDKYFAISVNNFKIKNDGGLDYVDAGATKKQVQDAFEQQLNQKLNSMVFLRTFIEEIS